MADVQRTGRVGRHELDHHLPPCAARAATEVGTVAQHAADDGTLGSGAQAQVDETGAGNLERLEQRPARRLAIELLDRCLQAFGDLARTGLQRPRQLQREIAGEIAVAGLLGPLEHDRRQRHRCARGRDQLFGGSAEKCRQPGFMFH